MFPGQNETKLSLPWMWTYKKQNCFSVCFYFSFFLINSNITFMHLNPWGDRQRHLLFVRYVTDTNPKYMYIHQMHVIFNNIPIDYNNENYLPSLPYLWQIEVIPSLYQAIIDSPITSHVSLTKIIYVLHHCLI